MGLIQLPSFVVVAEAQQATQFPAAQIPGAAGEVGVGIGFDIYNEGASDIFIVRPNENARAYKIEAGESRFILPYHGTSYRPWVCLQQVTTFSVGGGPPAGDYQFEIVDAVGDAHPVVYTSPGGETQNQIMDGIIAVLQPIVDGEDDLDVVLADLGATFTITGGMTPFFGIQGVSSPGGLAEAHNADVQLAVTPLLDVALAGRGYRS